MQTFNSLDSLASLIVESPKTESSVLVEKNNDLATTIGLKVLKQKETIEARKMAEIVRSNKAEQLICEYQLQFEKNEIKTATYKELMKIVKPKDFEVSFKSEIGLYFYDGSKLFKIINSKLTAKNMPHYVLIDKFGANIFNQKIVNFNVECIDFNVFSDALKSCVSVSENIEINAKELLLAKTSIKMLGSKIASQNKAIKKAYIDNKKASAK